MVRFRKKASRVRRAVRYVKRRVRHHQPISLLTTVPIAVKGVVEPILGNGKDYYGGWNTFKDRGLQAGITETVDILGINFLGYKLSDGSKWNNKMEETWTPIILGAVGSKVLTALGVNKHFAKLPMIGKKFKL